MNEEKNLATPALVLGLVSLITWLLPIVGLPTSVIAIVFGAKSLKCEKRNFAIAGLVLGIICCVFTVINSAIGAYMGAMAFS